MGADAAEAAIAKLELLYGQPKTDKPAAWVAEYRLALCEFHDDAIRAGIDELLRTRLMRGWPTIGDCVKACREAGPKVVPKPVIPRRMPWDPEDISCPPPTAEQRARVNELVRNFKASMLENSKEAFSRRRPVACDAMAFAERQAAREQAQAEPPVLTDDEEAAL